MHRSSIRKTMIRLAAALLGAALCHGAGATELVVIVSAKNPVTALRQEQVADIFLGQIGNFPGSAAVRKMVADNPSLIAYIDKSALDASVKPVLLVR